jgi:hypothetical protein
MEFPPRLFRPGVIEKLEVDCETVSKEPRIGEVTGYGKMVPGETNQDRICSPRDSIEVKLTRSVMEDKRQT